MNDTYTQFVASAKAMKAAQDLLAAAEDLIKHGNVLFHTPGDFDTWLKAVAANTRANNALIEIIENVREVQ